MIGDSDSDIEFGNRLGMKTILVGDNNEAGSSTTLSVPDAKMNSLADVANYFFNWFSLNSCLVGVNEYKQII